MARPSPGRKDNRPILDEFAPRNVPDSAVKDKVGTRPAPGYTGFLLASRGHSSGGGDAPFPESVMRSFCVAVAAGLAVGCGGPNSPLSAPSYDPAAMAQAAL